MKKVIVLGASEKLERYSNKAIRSLRAKSFEVIAIGNREGKVLDVPIILKEDFKMEEIDTISLYIGPKNQVALLSFLDVVKPRRVIFNPGTENPGFYPEIKKKGIVIEEACTLVLLSLSTF
jgi:predicted CoA-binding protein